MNEGLVQKQYSNWDVCQGTIWSIVYVFERDLHRRSLSNEVHLTIHPMIIS